MTVNQNIHQLKEVTFLKEAETPEFKHIPAFDGIRGIAILFVIIFHLPIPEITSFSRGGFLGVDIFFVLSGFLITSILLKEQSKTGKISLKNFFLRRSLRLLPAYWIFLISVYLFGSYICQNSDDIETLYGNYNFVAAFFYFTNWHWLIIGKAPIGLGHTWSLAIEEQFYILWSLILFLAFKEGKSRSLIFLGTLSLIIFLILLRTFRVLNGTEHSVIYFTTDSRMDSLLIGALFSMIFMWKIIPTHFYESKVFRFLVIFAGFAAFWIIFFGNTGRDFFIWKLPVFSTSIGLMVLSLAACGKSLAHSFLENKYLCWIGKISYGLYLWHLITIEISGKFFQPSFTLVLTAISLAFLISAISFYLIEMPFLKMKYRFGS